MVFCAAAQKTIFGELIVMLRDHTGINNIAAFDWKY
jgi:hypothetical protein